DEPLLRAFGQDARVVLGNLQPRAEGFLQFIVVFGNRTDQRLVGGPEDPSDTAEQTGQQNVRQCLKVLLHVLASVRNLVRGKSDRCGVDSLVEEFGKGSTA